MQHDRSRDGLDRVGDRKYLAVFAISAVIVLCITAVTPWIVRHWAPSDLVAKAAFASQFELTNALMSGLAFAAFVVTLWMQRDELRMQRQEIRANRKVMEDQKREFEAQVAAMRKQLLESRLFQLFKFQEDIRDSLVAFGARGRAGLDALAKNVRLWMRGEASESIDAYLQFDWRADHETSALWSQNQQPSIDNQIEDIAIRRYRAMRSARIGEWLDHYFKNLFVIVKYIDKEAMNDRDRAMYFSIFRAQLSKSEWILLFYHTLVEPELRAFIEKHNLFQDFNGNTELALPSHRHWSKSRFADDPPGKPAA